MSRKLKIQLDHIEKWLKDAPTQKHIETMTRYHNVHDVNGDEVEVIADTKQRVCDIWDKEAMMAEWSNIREEVESF